MKRIILKGVCLGLVFWIWVQMVATVTIYLRPDLWHEPGEVYLTPYAEKVLKEHNLGR